MHFCHMLAHQRLKICNIQPVLFLFWFDRFSAMRGICSIHRVVIQKMQSPFLIPKFLVCIHGHECE